MFVDGTVVKHRVDQLAGWNPALDGIETLAVEPSFPPGEEGVRGLGSSGVAARARNHSGDEALDRAHAEVLSEFRQPDGSYRIRTLGAAPHPSTDSPRPESDRRSRQA